MNDLETRKNGSGNEPSQALAKKAAAAIVCLAGGLVLLIAGALPGWLGIAVGIIVGAIGFGASLSKDPADKKAGIAIIIAGGLCILSKIKLFSVFAGFLLGAAALGLFCIGIWKGIQFLKGLKARS